MATDRNLRRSVSFLVLHSHIPHNTLASRYLPVRIGCNILVDTGSVRWRKETLLLRNFILLDGTLVEPLRINRGVHRLVLASQPFPFCPFHSISIHSMPRTCQISPHRQTGGPHTSHISHTSISYLQHSYFYILYIQLHTQLTGKPFGFRLSYPRRSRT